MSKMGYDRFGYYVGTGRKTYQRTIRMSEYIKENLESYNGNGMNEKFERLVLDCLFRLPQIEKEIEGKQIELKELSKEIESYRNFIADLGHLKFLTNDVIRKIDKMTKK